MSEMIDRVAKALCIAHGHNLEQQAPDNGDPVNMKMWETFKSVARLAIESMREPTTKQYDALCATDKMWSDLNSRIVWQTYIDAALKD